jgi:hypothetical protein
VKPAPRYIGSVPWYPPASDLVSRCGYASATGSPWARNPWRAASRRRVATPSGGAAARSRSSRPTPPVRGPQRAASRLPSTRRALPAERRGASPPGIPLRTRDSPAPSRCGSAGVSPLDSARRFAESPPPALLSAPPCNSSLPRRGCHGSLRDRRTTEVLNEVGREWANQDLLRQRLRPAVPWAHLSAAGQHFT